MAFTEGRKKTGGRKKGVGNKSTEQLREMVGKLMEDNMERIQSDIDSLEPKDRVKAMIDLMRFVLPTLKATDYVDKTQGVSEIIFTVSDKNGSRPLFSTSENSTQSDRPR